MPIGNVPIHGSLDTIDVRESLELERGPILSFHSPTGNDQSTHRYLSYTTNSPNNDICFINFIYLTLNFGKKTSVLLLTRGPYESICLMQSLWKFSICAKNKIESKMRV